MGKKKEQSRLKSMISDAIASLCKSGISYRNKINIQGLVGVTVDDEEIFLVNLDRSLGKNTPTGEFSISQCTNLSAIVNANKRPSSGADGKTRLKKSRLTQPDDGTEPISGDTSEEESNPSDNDDGDDYDDGVRVKAEPGQDDSFGASHAGSAGCNKGKKYKQAYTLFEKEALGKLCYKYKQEYNKTIETADKVWCSKKRMFVTPKPKEGFIAKAVREIFPDVNSKESYSEYKRVLSIAARALDSYERKLQDSPGAQPLSMGAMMRHSNRFRAPGAGRKKRTPGQPWNCGAKPAPAKPATEGATEAASSGETNAAVNTIADALNLKPIEKPPHTEEYPRNLSGPRDMTRDAQRTINLSGVREQEQHPTDYSQSQPAELPGGNWMAHQLHQAATMMPAAMPSHSQAGGAPVFPNVQSWAQAQGWVGQVPTRPDGSIVFPLFPPPEDDRGNGHHLKSEKHYYP